MGFTVRGSRIGAGLIALAAAVVGPSLPASAGRPDPPPPPTAAGRGAAAPASGTALTPSATDPTFHEFLDSGGFSSPQGIAVGPDGNFWIAEVFGSGVSRMTPAGVFTKFHISDESARFITRGPDGNMWFTENTDGGGIPSSTRGHIGRITMSGQLTEFTIPTPFSHPYAIAAGGDGNVWFTEDASKLGRITPSGQITEFTMPTQQGLADGIALGPDGSMWFGESLVDKLGRIDPNGRVSEFDLPAGSGPEGLVTGPDGNLWIVEGGSNKIGRLSLATRSLTEFPIPNPNSNAQLIAVGPDGNLWFTEARVGPDLAGYIGRISTTGAVAEFQTPPARRLFAEPFGITAGPNDGKMWFTEEVDGEIVSMTLPAAPGVPTTGLSSLIRPSAPQPPPIPEVWLPENNLVSPVAITRGPDGGEWFTERFKKAIGHIGTDGKVTEVPATAANFQAITTGPDGALWYCGADFGVVRLTTTGVEKDFTTPSNYCQYITTASDGYLWYVDTSSGHIGRMSTSGAATEFSITADGPIVAGADGSVWVTQTGEFGQSGVLRRIAPDGSVTDYPMTGLSPGGGTQPLTVTPDGNLWFTGITPAPNPSGFTSVIGRLTVATGRITTFPSGVRPPIVNSIVSAPDGSLWYDFGGNDTGPAGIVHMAPNGRILTKKLLPAGFATPQQLIVGSLPGSRGHSKAIWVAESMTDRLAYIDIG